MRTALSILLISATLAISGCFSYRPVASRSESAAVPTEAWPVRDAADLQALADATPDQLYGVVPIEQPGGSVEAPVVTYDVIDNRIAAGGLFRVYASRQEEDSFGAFFESYFFGFKRNATFISAYWFDRFGARTVAQARAGARQHDDNIRSWRPGFRLSRPTPDELLLVGSNISLGVPTAARDKGVLIHLPALVGNKYEQKVVEHLEAQGWTILHIESDTNVRGPNHVARVHAQRERESRRSELISQHPDNPFTKRETVPVKVNVGRTIKLDYELSKAEQRTYRRIAEAADEQARREIPIPETGFEIHEGDDLAAKADVIADAVNEHLADHAYAAEAALQYVDEAFPVLAERPIVVIGFSAGSLAAPTVAARLRELHPERLRAMVLVGSGAPLLDVARKSTITDGGLILTPENGPAPSPEILDQLQTLYLERAGLDPWNTAAALRDLPVLHVYGARDKIVPSSAARRLNERLEPDRLVFSGGHLGLFYFLPGQKNRIARWIDRNIDDE